MRSPSSKRRVATALLGSSRSTGASEEGEGQGFGIGRGDDGQEGLEAGGSHAHHPHPLAHTPHAAVVHHSHPLVTHHAAHAAGHHHRAAVVGEGLQPVAAGSDQAHEHLGPLAGGQQEFGELDGLLEEAAVGGDEVEGVVF